MAAALRQFWQMRGYIAAALAALTEEQFAAAWGQGQAMSLEDAILYAQEIEDTCAARPRWVAARMTVVVS